MTKETTRRRFIAAAGVAGLGSAAGCIASPSKEVDPTKVEILVKPTDGGKPFTGPLYGVGIVEYYASGLSSVGYVEFGIDIAAGETPAVARAEWFEDGELTGETRAVEEDAGGAIVDPWQADGPPDSVTVTVAGDKTTRTYMIGFIPPEADHDV